MDRKPERRSWTPLVEHRTDEGKDQVIFKGHPIVYDQLSEIMYTPDGEPFRERVKPGAWDMDTSSMDVEALVDHDSKMLLASTRTGRIKIGEDDTGIAVEITPIMTSYARDTALLVEAGEKNKMSYGFYALEDSWDDGEDDIPVRTLNQMAVFDFTITGRPAYPQTDVGVEAGRSLREWRTKREAAPQASTEPEPAQEPQDPADGPETVPQAVSPTLEKKVELLWSMFAPISTIGDETED